MSRYDIDDPEYNDSLFDFLRFASPRLVVEAIAQATGWEEPK